MLMVCGASISKTRAYPGFIKYQPPSLWKKMGQIRSKRDLRDDIASKIGEHSFESMRYSRNYLLELYPLMLKDEKSAIEITVGLGLELEELIYLSGSSKASKKIHKIYEQAHEFLLKGKEESNETEFFRTPISSGNDIEVFSSFEVKSPEKKTVNSSEKSKISDSRISQGGQKTLSFNITSPDTSRKMTNESLEVENFLSPEIPEIQDNISHEFSKPEDSINCYPNTKKVPDGPDGSETPEIKASETPKKDESKTQKTLFDF